MDKSILEIMAKLAQVKDPNNPYSLDDFNKDFSLGVGQEAFLNRVSEINSNQKEFMAKLQIRFSNKSSNPDPEYATSGASGFDLRANLTESLYVDPRIRVTVPTGLYFELPENMEIQIRPRSGLAFKNGVTVLNSPGTIDADYRGEIKVILINHGHEPFVINHGDRIAQAVIAACIGKNVIQFNKVEEVMSNTDRGEGGFGSTGHK
jgi:dUTP pyrophosphatase